MNKNKQADRIMDDIRQVLLKEWDPVGVGKDTDIQDEYDSYIGGIYLCSHQVEE
jgi:hypothetical protein